MSPAQILLQLDPDPQPSVFDGVVAVDAGVAQLFRHGGVTPAQVTELVYGCIFTRGGDKLRHTAIFVGGSQVAPAEELFRQVQRTFFGPMRVSVMLDANGSNTTAAAAVLAAKKHMNLADAVFLVLGGTGPVGQRVARLLAGAGATVRVGSRQLNRASSTCTDLRLRVPGGKFEPVATLAHEDLLPALAGAQGIIAAGAPGAEMLAESVRRQCPDLRVAIDLNAVPPVGLTGVSPTDAGTERDGVATYGALGVGGTKMKIHKAAIAKLFTANDLTLDAEEIYQLGVELRGEGKC
ncbi:MAG: NADP-dependent methylenetetrahydromethanopterin/methylenetetrahydrofolate dehydrogenase [Pirellulales bacterium]|nr:NADP-dependent methylenetetrahydromethanopterin/methylenetetrahydrofolate dehydrogenase [Pirellulales bacterium]